jgi:hypothetical protein
MSRFDSEEYRKEVVRRLQRVSGVDTEPALAEKMGITQQALNKWIKKKPGELGHKQILHYLWRRWEEGDHISLDFIYYGLGEPVIEGAAASESLLAFNDVLAKIQKFPPNAVKAFQSFLEHLTP